MTFKDIIYNSLLYALRSLLFSKVLLSLLLFLSYLLNSLLLPIINKNKVANFNNLIYFISNFSNFIYFNLLNLYLLYTKDDNINTNYNNYPISFNRGNLENYFIGLILSKIYIAKVIY